MSVWYGSKNTGSWVAGKRFSIDEPSVTIMAAGMAGDSIGHWHLFRDNRSMKSPPRTNKPPYLVPSMAEINALPWNGLRVVSTFSGCGGSCLGYRMAGYRVVWANEFVLAAQEVYRLNHPTSILDTRDIREVMPEDVLAATNMEPGECDLFDGSPPCSSFSTAGKRSSGWGKEKAYSDTSQRTDDLFFEYARLLSGIQPKVFVAENVSGLVKGVAKGYFIEIMTALRECGYNVACRVLDAQWLGVPQARQRAIFIGVRNDVGRDPVFPSPLPYRYSLRDACPWICRMKVDTKGSLKVRDNDGSKPCDTITVTNKSHITVEAESDISKYCTGLEWDKLKPGEQSGKYFSLVKTDSDKPCPTICATHGSGGIASPTHPYERRKFAIAELKRICGFPDDFELTGSYAQQWERLGRSVPPVMMCQISGAIRDGVFRGL